MYPRSTRPSGSVSAWLHASNPTAAARLRNLVAGQSILARAAMMAIPRSDSLASRAFRPRVERKPTRVHLADEWRRLARHRSHQATSASTAAPAMWRAESEQTAAPRPRTSCRADGDQPSSTDGTCIAVMTNTPSRKNAAERGEQAAGRSAPSPARAVVLREGSSAPPRIQRVRKWHRPPRVRATPRTTGPHYRRHHRSVRPGPRSTESHTNVLSRDDGPLPRSRG